MIVASTDALATVATAGTAALVTTALSRTAAEEESREALMLPAMGWPTNGARSARRVMLSESFPVGNVFPAATSNVPLAARLFQLALSITIWTPPA